MATVLIADDEPITRMDLKGMLTELGYEVCGEAADGFDAVEMCRTFHPDAVLMDVKMPVFDGLSAAGLILQEELAKTVVLLTAYNDTETIRCANEIGVSGYLVKPVEQRLLRPTIEVALSQSEKIRQSRLETKKAIKQYEDSRVIARAQQYLSKKEHVSEAEAYQMLRRLSMDKRVPMATLAAAFINQEEKKP